MARRQTARRAKRAERAGRRRARCRASAGPQRPGGRARPSAVRRSWWPRSTSSRRAGFAATRLDDVASRAGVAKGTIYLHFRDKESLPGAHPLDAGPVRRHPRGGADSGRPAGARHRRAQRRPVRARDLRDTTQGRDPADPHRGPRASRTRRVLLSRGASARARGVCAPCPPRCGARRTPQRRAGAVPAVPGRAWIMAIIWNGLFDRFEPIDPRELLRAHLDILFGRREGGIKSRPCTAPRWRLPWSSFRLQEWTRSQSYQGWIEAEPHLRQPRRRRAGSSRCRSAKAIRSSRARRCSRSTTTCSAPTSRIREAAHRECAQALDRAPQRC